MIEEVIVLVYVPAQFLYVTFFVFSAVLILSAVRWFVGWLTGS